MGRQLDLIPVSRNLWAGAMPASRAKGVHSLCHASGPRYSTARRVAYARVSVIPHQLRVHVHDRMRGRMPCVAS